MDAALGVSIDPSGARQGADVVVRSLNGIKGSARTVTTEMKDRFSSVKDTLFSLKTAFAGLGVGLLARSFTDAASTSEGFRVRLNVLLGDVEEGGRLFQEMSRYASTVSFSYEEIMASATALSGVLKGGVDEITGLMPLIGDLAAASGLTIEETTSQIIRMWSSGAASADMFRERGILAMLGFQSGVSYSAEETKKQVIAAWEDSGSKFKNASVELASTWEGLMSMYGDQWFNFRNKVMDNDPFDFMKASFSELLDLLNENKDDVDALAKSMGEGIVDGFKSFLLGTAGLLDTLTPAFNQIKETSKDLHENYKSLPKELQTYGLIGALLLGKKGMVVAGVALSLVDDAKLELEYFKQYQAGNVGFFDWLFTLDKDKVLNNLEQIKMKSGTIFRPDEGSNLPETLPGLPSPEEAREQVGILQQAVLNFFDGVEKRQEEMRQKKGDREKSTLGDITGVEKDALSGVLFEGKEYNKILKEGMSLYEKMRTPQEKYSDNLLKIQELLFHGAITDETANRARKAYLDNLNKELDKQNKQLKQNKKTADELGFSFSSAFEDAVAGGEKFSDVLDGLKQDIARLILRQAVTSPMASAISGFISEGLRNFADGGDFTVGGTGGTDSQIVAFNATPGEKVSVRTPQQMEKQGGTGAIQVQNTYVIDASDNTDLEERIMVAMSQAQSLSYASVLKDVQTNGKIRRSLGV